MTGKIITLFGSGKTKQSDKTYALAFNTGRALAGAGLTIANGGYGGTMQAAAKGARTAGGQVIGVTCSTFASEANEYITEEIVTGSLDERLDKLLQLGTAYVVLPGGTGTLLELAKVWELKNKGFLTEAKPVIIVGDFWMGLLASIESEDPGSARHIRQAKEPQDVVGLLKESLPQ